MFGFNFKLGSVRRTGDLLPLPDDLNFRFNKREDLTAIDAINGNNASITGGYVAKLGSNIYADVTPITIVDGESISVTFKRDNLATYNDILYGEKTLPLRRGSFQLSSTNNVVVFGVFYSDESGGENKSIVFTDNIPTDYLTLNISIDGTDLIVNRDDTDETIVSDVGKSFYLYYDMIGRNTANSIRGNICCVKKDGELLYGMNSTLRNSQDGTEGTNNGMTFDLLNDIELDSTECALRLGYYQNDTTGEQVINESLNTTALSDTTGWTAHEGGKVHNGVISFINFNPTLSADVIFNIWNRSVATAVYNDQNRDRDSYDSSKVWTHLVTELLYDTINSDLEAAYKDRNFLGINPDYGEQLYYFTLLSYKAPLTGVTLVKGLDYINYNH